MDNTKDNTNSVSCQDVILDGQGATASSAYLQPCPQPHPQPPDDVNTLDLLAEMINSLLIDSNSTEDLHNYVPDLDQFDLDLLSAGDWGDCGDTLFGAASGGGSLASGGIDRSSPSHLFGASTLSTDHHSEAAEDHTYPVQTLSYDCSSHHEGLTDFDSTEANELLTPTDKDADRTAKCSL